MRTRTFCLTQQQANELQAAYLQAAYLQAQEAHTKTRYQAVRLYGLGYSPAQICDICACSTRSLLNWSGAYQQGGPSALVDQRRGGNRAKLGPQQVQALRRQLHRYTPAQLLSKEACAADGPFWSIADLATLLQREHALTYQSQTSYRNLLQKCAFSYQRPAKQHKSHAALKVMEFEERLEKNP